MKLKLSFLFAFLSIYSWSQSSTTETFNANGTFTVPAGVTNLSVEAWGGGGAGGGAAGAGLLFGRGAAGGGGGAYASASISVTAASVLNVIVAGQTIGTTGAGGAAGGNSTIAGFETSILAAGGSGGAGNTGGGTPAGGNGGTIAASSGAIRLAGVNGGNGSSWSLLSLLLSSGAGGAGANAGGAGGASVSSILFGNASGNAGTSPGGAGSGAINSGSGASQIGGTGGAGRLIITYTCSAFSLTSTAASSVCAGSGTTSTVSLTGSAASLPAGNYVVTYNRSNPSAAALTANLTVTTAGTGSFTAIGFTNAGSSTITITKLASASCSSAITTNNTAIVTISPAPVGGTVTGGTSICSGNTSGVLSLSGNVGAVVKWQFAVSPFTTWTDVSNPSTNNTYTSTALTETTQFRAVVGGGSCGTVNSTAVTVTVNSTIPSIQLDENSFSFCLRGTDFLDIGIYYHDVEGAPVTYSIIWDSFPPNSFVDVHDEAFPSPGDPIKFVVPVGVTSAGTYTGTLTVKNANGCVSSGSVMTFIFYDVPPAVEQFFHACPSDQYATQTGNININATGYFIDWDSLPDQYDVSYDFASNTTINDVVVPPSLSAGLYTGTIYFSNGPCGGDGAPVSLEITACESLTEKNKPEENNVSVHVLNKALNIDSSQGNINQVFVYDISGNLVYKKEGISSSELSINDLRSRNQVLIVKVILDNNKVETRKVGY